MTPETTEAINFLDKWLEEVIYNQPTIKQNVNSKLQENMYDCGIWAIKNAVAYMKTNTKVVSQLNGAMQGVTVDLGDRAFFVERIFSMLTDSRKQTAQPPLPVRQETHEQKQIRVTSGQLAGIDH
jgi:hypothetical protein